MDAPGNALPMAAKSVVEPEIHLTCGGSRQIVEILNCILKHIGVVKVRQILPGLVSSAFSGQVAILIGWLVTEIWEVPIGVNGVVIVKLTWFPRCIGCHDDVWE